MWSDTLTAGEAEYTRRAIDALRHVEWAKPLLRRVDKAGGLVAAAMPLLFEVRFGFELHRSGASPEYEYSAGVGDSTVEFRIPGAQNWLVELVSIRASEAVKAATRQTGMLYKQALSTNASDRAQSEEAEMITAEQKIGEKVFSDGKPTKFPEPGSAFHVILADMRGYLDEGGDFRDYREIAYGRAGFPPQDRWVTHSWETEPGRREPIAGLFEESNRLRASAYVRQRIHFLGFIREREFTEGEIQNKAYYLANPHLFGSEAEALAAFETSPLKPVAGAPSSEAK